MDENTEEKSSAANEGTVPAIHIEDTAEKPKDGDSKADGGKLEANKENYIDNFDSAPPTPTSVPVLAPFTSEDTLKMHSVTERKDDDLSLIVNVDESPNEFDLPEAEDISISSDVSAKTSELDTGKISITEKAMLDAEKDFQNSVAGEKKDSGDDKTTDIADKTTDVVKKDGVKIDGDSVSTSTPSATPTKAGQDSSAEKVTATAKDDPAGKESRLVIKTTKTLLKLWLYM